MFPSILTVSFCSSTSINSFSGQGDSKQSIPSPSIPKLNSPSFPATAEEILLRMTAFCFNVDSQAKNRPSSKTIELFHSFKSNNRI